jgi:hypothetical protein
MFSLPLYPAMTESQVEYVATTAKDIARNHRKHRPVFAKAAAS